ncbi:nitroreductase family deazaflavin-dependent oxidoreductase [Williamsia muralis]|uniref:nitroreductase/quinone reductase family protein n=1 Tax=Williamsia marianensis TaxID=85044 RepID=UPI003F189D32
MYRDGRPHSLARFINSLSSRLYSRGLFKRSGGATLTVRGRRSGRPVSLPVVIAEHDGSRYLVSTLGDDANWVHNVREAGGDAELNQRPVHLVEIPIGERASILRCYLQIAPGARPHSRFPIRHR